MYILCTSNLLLDASCEIKINDFDTSEFFNIDNQTTCTLSKSILANVASELFFNERTWCYFCKHAVKRNNVDAVNIIYSSCILKRTT